MSALAGIVMAAAVGVDVAAAAAAFVLGPERYVWESIAEKLVPTAEACFP